MTTSTRKQREVRQRELMLLDVARSMLIEHGYAGLSMDRLADATEYSKGTLYQHFSTKEDLVTALAMQSLEQRTQLFARGATFDGRPRERFLAVLVADELFGRLNPHHYHSELIIKMADLEERASAGRRESLRQLECVCMAGVLTIVEEAVAQGDLTLTPPSTPGDVVYAGFTLVIGTQATVLNFRTVLQDLGIKDPVASTRQNVQAVLDGFGWRPLRAEWDYASTFTRIAREVFADEWRRAGLELG